MARFTGIPRMAIRLAGVFLAGEARTSAWGSATLAGKKDGGLPLPDLGAKESAGTKAIASSR